MIELSIDFYCTMPKVVLFSIYVVKGCFPFDQSKSPDFAMGNLTFLSIEDQTDLRLHSERYTAALGLFRLACISIWVRDFCSI